MQLLNWWAFNVTVTALLVSGVVAGIAAGAAVSIGGGNFPRVCLAALAFSLLGFVTGEIMGDAREPAVGTVVPAVLTLLGGVAAYVIGSRGIRAQTAVSALLFCFTLSLLVGAVFGIRLRIEYQFALEDPDYLRRRALALEDNQLALEVQRLKDYVTLLHLKQGFAEAKKLDLSRFESVLEKKPNENKQEAPVRSK